MLKISSPTLTLRVQNNPERVVIDDEAAIPEKYLRVIPETKAPDKKLILETHKAGIGVDGTHTERSTRLVIK